MGKRILFVDDEPDLLKVTTFRLKKAGYELLTADNGNDALSLARKESLDLIFLDIRLPGMNGDEVCKQLKSDEKYKHIPIILFTASANCVADKAKEVGAEDYIIKPFNPQDLLAKVKKLIGDGQGEG
jgi:CheY-like chemotaxis protein